MAKRKNITPEQKEKATELCVRMLAKMYRPTHCKHALYSQFGISSRNAERYITAARERLRQEAGLTDKAMARASLAEFYGDIMRKSKDVKLQMWAAAALRKLGALDLPADLPDQGGDGNVPDVELGEPDPPPDSNSNGSNNGHHGKPSK